jgi:3-(3-hydroxy-phenyl)propionate hydroxylase
MCAGIRDASNLAWKISLCLKNGHNEKLLDTYQSERFSNVEEYIQTTMRMGEFINDIGTSKITNNISENSDGTMSMKSIQPELGPGLGKKSDKNRGKPFPQLTMNNGTRLDLMFAKQPVLLLDSKLKDNELKSKIKSFYGHQVVGLADLLNYYNAKAIIVRPDRFILETCPPGSDLNEFIKNKLNELNIV